MAGANIILSAGLNIDESLANLKKDIQTIQDRLNAAGIKITLPVDLDEKIVKSLKDIGNGKTTAESGKKIGDALATSLINQFNIRLVAKARRSQHSVRSKIPASSYIQYQSESCPPGRKIHVSCSFLMSLVK